LGTRGGGWKDHGLQDYADYTDFFEVWFYRPIRDGSLSNGTVTRQPLFSFPSHPVRLPCECIFSHGNFMPAKRKAAPKDNDANIGFGAALWTFVDIRRALMEAEIVPRVTPTLKGLRRKGRKPSLPFVQEYLSELCEQ
jgi:hypothetical protein